MLSMKKSKSCKQNLKSGFTLVEMMVSVAIFAIVMTIALGSLLAMSESDRRAQTLKSVINNLNFALDSMSRAIRTGQGYHCDAAMTPLSDPRDCASTPATSFAFQPAGGSTVYYCLGVVSPSVACNPSGTYILRSNGFSLAPITAAEVRITALRFYVTGATATGIQPKVTILISGVVTVSGTQNSPFNLQTSVTQRLYDQ